MTLNRPEVHNALDEALVDALTDALKSLDADPNVSALVLTGTGRTFCAGADLNMIRRTAHFNYADNVVDAHRNARLFTTLAGLSKPTIARVHGNAFGAGVGLVACCSVAFAAADAQFALAEVRFGLIPATVGAFVVAAIGARYARHLFLTGERFSASSAHRMGLVHEVVPAQQLDLRIEAVLSQIRAQNCPPGTNDCDGNWRTYVPTGG